jgi:hypothetical protein
MTYPDISTLTLRILATADAILMEPVKPPLSEVAVHGGRRYCAVRDILQAAFDEAMKAEPAASPPAFDLVARLVDLREKVFALWRDAKSAGFRLIPAKLARMQADLSNMADDLRAEELAVQAFANVGLPTKEQKP